MPDKLHFSSSGAVGSWFASLPNGRPASNEWLQVGCWFDSSTLNTGAIVNGQKLSSAATLSALPQLTAPIWIGRADYAWGNATTAIVQIYNRNLSADEVTQSFNSFRGRFGI